jgi:hypothetical protein
MRTIQALALAVLALADGCTDECSSADSRCDGDRIASCHESDGFLGNTWADGQDCDGGKICVEATYPDGGSTGALCTASAELDPRCRPDLAWYRTCGDRHTVLRCWLGHADEYPCAGDGECLVGPDGVTVRCVDFSR